MTNTSCGVDNSCTHDCMARAGTLQVHDGLYNQRVRQGDGQGKKHKAQDL